MRKNYFLYVALSLFLSGSVVFAQSPGNIIDIFGGFVQAAMAEAARVEWNKLPPKEIACLDQTLVQRGLSIETLVRHGIMPSDGRVADLRSNCRNQFAQQPSQAPRADPQTSKYSVDGLAQGDQVRFDSATYREYQCTPSDQFVGFTWCQKRRVETEARGQYTSSWSILHSADGTTFYVSRSLVPAFFTADEANEEIARVSKKHGAQPRIIPMPPGSGVPNGAIALWGKVALEPLDASSVEQLAAGRNVRRGFLIDHIGNNQRSAQLGLPIYGIRGGPGYIWAASYDQSGRGTLRFLAIDASGMSPSVQAEQQPSPAPPKPADADSGRRAAAEADQARRAAEEIARQKTAEADQARRAAEEKARQKTDEANVAKMAADKLAEQNDDFKKQIEEQKKTQNFILISIAALFLLLCSIGAFLVLRSRKTANVVAEPAAVPIATPSSSNAGNIQASSEKVNKKGKRSTSKAEVKKTDPKIATENVDEQRESTNSQPVTLLIPSTNGENTTSSEHTTTISSQEQPSPQSGLLKMIAALFGSSKLAPAATARMKELSYLRADAAQGTRLTLLGGRVFLMDEEKQPVMAEAGDIEVYLNWGQISIWPIENLAPLRYSRHDDIRCIEEVDQRSEAAVGKTLKRMALSGFGWNLLTGHGLTGHGGGLGAAVLDYRIAGAEKRNIVAVNIVFRDFSMIAIECAEKVYSEICAGIPPHVFSDETATETLEHLATIQRMAQDGPRIYSELAENITNTCSEIKRVELEVENGKTFSERDTARTKLEELKSDLAIQEPTYHAVRSIIETSLRAQST